MIRYVALLRGINVSGKNKITMDELKAGCRLLGYQEIQTYFNSGNIAFSSEQGSTSIIQDQLRNMIKERFELDIPVYVTLQCELEDVLHHAPEWWGNDDKEIYDNLIFIMEPATFSDLFREIGSPKDGIERIENYKNAVFWSFSRKEYQKTNWWSKTVTATISAKLTIRTAGTIRKICGI